MNFRFVAGADEKHKRKRNCHKRRDQEIVIYKNCPSVLKSSEKITGQSYSDAQRLKRKEIADARRNNLKKKSPSQGVYRNKQQAANDSEIKSKHLTPEQRRYEKLTTKNKPSDFSKIAKKIYKKRRNKKRLKSESTTTGTKTGIGTRTDSIRNTTKEKSNKEKFYGQNSKKKRNKEQLFGESGNMIKTSNTFKKNGKNKNELKSNEQKKSSGGKKSKIRRKTLHKNDENGKILVKTTEENVTEKKKCNCVYGRDSEIVSESWKKRGRKDTEGGSTTPQQSSLVHKKQQVEVNKKILQQREGGQSTAISKSISESTKQKERNARNERNSKNYFPKKDIHKSEHRKCRSLSTFLNKGGKECKEGESISNKINDLIVREENTAKFANNKMKPKVIDRDRDDGIDQKGQLFAGSKKTRTEVANNLENKTETELPQKKAKRSSGLSNHYQKSEKNKDIATSNRAKPSEKSLTPSSLSFSKSATSSTSSTPVTSLSTDILEPTLGPFTTASSTSDTTSAKSSRTLNNDTSNMAFTEKSKIISRDHTKTDKVINITAKQKHGDGVRIKHEKQHRSKQAVAKSNALPTHAEEYDDRKIMHVEAYMQRKGKVYDMTTLPKKSNVQVDDLSSNSNDTLESIDRKAKHNERTDSTLKCTKLSHIFPFQDKDNQAKYLEDQQHASSGETNFRTANINKYEVSCNDEPCEIRTKSNETSNGESMRTEELEQKSDCVNVNDEITTSEESKTQRNNTGKAQDRTFVEGLVEIRTLLEIYGIDGDKKDAFDKLLDNNRTTSDNEISRNLKKAVGDLPMDEKLLQKVLKKMQHSGLLEKRRQKILRENLVPQAVNGSVTIALIAQVLQQQRLSKSILNMFKKTHNASCPKNKSQNNLIHLLQYWYLTLFLELKII
ncbi:unnamed protein product [Thelazia callipaeda]|uniref:MATH and LRR domain-containing protein PFE0570w-like n=1 Tax=Thelazia callipaeda TaxID=103827 RepID=A0A0N5D9F2_THECL|nr:unnamed protein product [Thelazia callipaeda]